MTGPNSYDAERADLKAQINVLARLVDISVTLSSTLDFQRLINYIITAAAELLEAEVASLLLYDEKQNELRFFAATGSDPAELAKIPVPLNASIAGTIFRENRAIIINDVSRDSRHFRKVGEKVNFHSKMLLGVPMRIKDRVTGVLEALNKKTGSGFTEFDARIFSIIASQAAVAIENARLVTALQEAYDDLGKLDKMKSDFIAIASHELRTPLGVILGYATFLREDAKGETGQYAQAVFDSAVHMRKLVEDMTNLRFMEVGQMPVQREAVNLRELLAEARQDTLVLAEAKGQKILLLPCDPPPVAQADRAKLIVAVSNLINNAIRYTPEGGAVELSVYRKDDEAWLQVKDNGRGISQRNLESIFDGFYQVEDHMTRRSGGLGIGLSIVRNTMKLLGGRVWAESPGEGRGSTFICALPLTAKSGSAPLLAPTR